MSVCIFCGKQIKRESTFLKHYYECETKFETILNSYSQMSLEEKRLFDEWKAQVDALFDKHFRKPDLIERKEIADLQADIALGLRSMEERLAQIKELQSIPFPNKSYTDLDYSELEKRKSTRSSIVVSYKSGNP